MRRWCPGVIVGAQPQVLGRVVGRYHLAGIHLPLRVPQRLELPERADQLLAEHLRQQLRARLPVAMLAGERAVVLHTEVGRLVDVGAVFRDAWCALQVEVVARVNAGLAEVTVQIAGVAVLVHQLPQLAEVLAEVLRIDSRVLPAFPCTRLAGDERRRTEAGLANLPDLVLVLLAVEQPGGGSVLLLAESGDHPVRFRVGLLLRLAAEFDQQPSFPLGEQGEAVRVQTLGPHVGHEAVM